MCQLLAVFHDSRFNVFHNPNQRCVAGIHGRSQVASLNLVDLAGSERQQVMEENPRVSSRDACKHMSVICIIVVLQELLG